MQLLQRSSTNDTIATHVKHSRNTQKSNSLPRHHSKSGKKWHNTEEAAFKGRQNIKVNGLRPDTGISVQAVLFVLINQYMCQTHYRNALLIHSTLRLVLPERYYTVKM